MNKFHTAQIIRKLSLLLALTVSLLTCTNTWAQNDTDATEVFAIPPKKLSLPCYLSSPAQHTIAIGAGLIAAGLPLFLSSEGQWPKALMAGAATTACAYGCYALLHQFFATAAMYESAHRAYATVARQLKDDLAISFFRSGADVIAFAVAHNGGQITYPIQTSLRRLLDQFQILKQTRENLLAARRRCSDDPSELAALEELEKQIVILATFLFEKISFISKSPALKNEKLQADLASTREAAKDGNKVGFKVSETITHSRHPILLEDRE